MRRMGQLVRPMEWKRMSPYPHDLAAIATATEGLASGSVEPVRAYVAFVQIGLTSAGRD
jgi:hypothetical protein